MKTRLVASAAAALLLTGAMSFAADIKSGPQKGDSPKAFNPLHATGKGAGGKACLV
jgi:uncharacterized protein YfiM (DUF2279 family)